MENKNKLPRQYVWKVGLPIAGALFLGESVISACSFKETPRIYKKYTPIATLNGKPMEPEDFMGVDMGAPFSQLHSAMKIVETYRRDLSRLEAIDQHFKVDGTLTTEGPVEIEITTPVEGSDPMTIVKLPRVNNPKKDSLRLIGQSTLLIKDGKELYIPTDKEILSPHETREFTFDPKIGEVYATTTITNHPEAEKLIRVERFNWENNSFDPLVLPASIGVLQRLATDENYTFPAELPRSLPLDTQHAIVKSLTLFSLGVDPKAPENISIYDVSVPRRSKEYRDAFDKAELLLTSLENVEINLPEEYPMYALLEERKVTYKSDPQGVQLQERFRVIKETPLGFEDFYTSKWEAENLNYILHEDWPEIDPKEFQDGLMNEGKSVEDGDYINPLVADHYDPEGKIARGEIARVWRINPGFYLDHNDNEIQTAIPFTKIITVHPDFTRKPSTEIWVAPSSENEHISFLMSGIGNMHQDVPQEHFFLESELFPTAERGGKVDVTDQVRKARVRGEKTVDRIGILSPKENLGRLAHGYTSLRQGLADITSVEVLKLINGQSKVNAWGVALEEVSTYRANTRNPDQIEQFAKLPRGSIFPIHDQKSLGENLFDRDPHFIINPGDVEHSDPNIFEVLGGITIPVRDEIKNIQIIWGNWSNTAPDKKLQNLSQLSYECFINSKRGKRVRALLNMVS